MDDCGLQGIHPRRAQPWKLGAYYPRTDPVSPGGRGRRVPDGCRWEAQEPSELVPSLALSLSLGLRGMVVVADKTAELYKTTYWASYNIPYVLPFSTPTPICSP